MKRREFLQRSVWATVFFGLGEPPWGSWEHHGAALAQPTSRKLALLVGINQYPAPTIGISQPLQGCLADVELQRELLVHRFGFQPSDIVTLTDQQATRSGIEIAFREHLIKQAKAGDVVLFHFSGYGGRVRSPIADSVSPALTYATLVPVDGGVRETSSPHESPEGSLAAVEVNDITDETLFLLLRALATDQITTILDTSCPLMMRGEGEPGGRLPFLRMRSRLGLVNGALSRAEVAQQEASRQALNLTVQQVRAAVRNKQMPGLVLTATNHTDPLDGSAFEASLNGMTAGLFTAALTQYLWWATPAMTVQVSLSRSTGTIEQLVGTVQQPGLAGQKSREPVIVGNFLPVQAWQNADGVITQVEDGGKVGLFWPIGLPPLVREHYGLDSVLQVLPPRSRQSVETFAPTALQVTAREGDRLRVRVFGSEVADSAALQEGLAVQEVVRVLSRNPGLTVALSPELEKIERVDATSALATLPMVRVASPEHLPDCLFGRLGKLPVSRSTEAALPGAIATADLRYGLFSLGQELLPGTLMDRGDAVKVAIQRLGNRFRTLLALKLLRLTANEGSSQLGVQAILETLAPEEQILAGREAGRGLPIGGFAPNSSLPTPGPGTLAEMVVPRVAVGKLIHYRVKNWSDRSLYLLWIGLDSNGQLILLYPGQPPANPDITATETGDTQPQLRVAAGKTLAIPRSDNSFTWHTREPKGLVEMYLLCSVQPFHQTLAALAAGNSAFASGTLGENQRLIIPLNPLAIAQAVLADLHHASTEFRPSSGNSPETIALHVKAWATFHFFYQVV